MTEPPPTGPAPQEPAPPGRWAAAADAQLAALYARIPQVACQGLCGPVDCTDDIGMGPRERQRLRQAGVVMPPRRPATPASAAPGPCPALEEGRCSAYAVRPAICRIYSATEGLACPHGCPIIDGRPLSSAEAFALVDAAAAAGTSRTAPSAEAFQRQLDSDTGRRILDQQKRDQRIRRDRFRRPPPTG
ncbi:YkgJ family cysteine cluster protein [Streptosporangium sandarakinum]|uniref:YkgJ family cysteine cluster protein n=1 Tax=Streptosporangium sandarakinum TaxID=1260955 RepID=UPI00371EE137